MDEATRIFVRRRGRATSRLLNMNTQRLVRLRRELLGLGKFAPNVS